jgi:solute carrier family 6 amino acid/orphan transporter-like 15/16/17/18/20
MLAILGIPLFFLEVAIGQRLRKGAIGVWNEVSPYLVGIGFASALICLFIGFYYNTLVAWILSYMISVCKSS